MSASLELYGYRTGNCMRAAIALEEASLPFTTRHIDLRAAAHHRLDFLSLNPAGKVPVLVDRRSGTEIAIAQSNAIMLYIADTAPDRLLPANSIGDRARLLERFFHFVTEVIAPSFAAFQTRSMGEQIASEGLTRIAVAQLQASERFLDRGEYLGGERFSIVDIAAVTIANALERHVDWSSFPALHAWF